jgi:AcrR family transcriptional regulator
MAKNELKTGKDPRVRYTRKILKDSLLELMKTRAVAGIGIKEICALAEVSRSTFYTYYEDVHDLLEEIEEEVFTFFTDMINKYSVSLKRGSRYSEATFEKMLHYIADASNVLQILLGENGDPDFQTKFFQRYIALSQKILHDSSGDPRETYIHEGCSIFVVHGATGLMRYWLKNNMPIPIPTLAKMLVKLTQPTRGLAWGGVNNEPSFR